ncbi:MAG: phosphodiesterase [Clostridiales bacterium]|nr:phosphodiesterase [Clostridiales bacterium]
MKYFVISDIHGSVYYFKKAIEQFEKENCDKLIILGDFYYHGPRNPLTEEYDPMKVSEMVRSMKDKIIAIRGNCDAQVDEMISEMEFKDILNIESNGKIITLTHGHKFNKDNMPDNCGDILLYGHFHLSFLEKQNDKIIGSPGSISLPKNNTERGYIIIEDNNIILKDLDGNIIEQMQI